MTGRSISNQEFLDQVLTTGEYPVVPVLLPHEQEAVEQANQKNIDDLRQIVQDKISVSGGDDWHDGAFRATDNEAKIVSERNAVIAPYLGATIVSYPAETEARVTLGSRVLISQNGYAFPVDVIGFRKGYPDDVIDPESNEEVTGVSPESPLGKAIIGKTAGDESKYKNGERSVNVNIVRINQTAVSEYFMTAANVQIENSEG